MAHYDARRRLSRCVALDGYQIQVMLLPALVVRETGPARLGVVSNPIVRRALQDGRVLIPRWKRVLVVLAPVWATVFGAAMAVQWELGGSGDFEDGPPGAATVGRWMADTLPLMEAGEPLWWWRGPFFLCLVALLPFVWAVTSRVPSVAARRCTRGGLLVAAGAIGLEYSTPGYGWLFDLVALLVASGGTVACGVSALRHRAMPRRLAWSLISALPLTPPAGFLVFWYLPPGLTMGLLLSWALAAVLGPKADPAASDVAHAWESRLDENG